MFEPPGILKPLSSLRLWLMVFALLFSQWVFANHEHDEEYATDGICQICLLADHFDAPLASYFTPFCPISDYADVVALYSITASPVCSGNTARAPPHFLLT